MRTALSHRPNGREHEHDVELVRVVEIKQESLPQDAVDIAHVVPCSLLVEPGCQVAQLDADVHAA